MRFLREREPEHEVALAVVPGVWRVVAKNAGPMTYHGTNSYLIENDGISVLDPGPDDAEHAKAVLTAAGGHIDRILLSHGHRDHVGGAARLSALSGAPVFGFVPSIDPDVHIDHALEDGDEVSSLAVLHTPGHAADHLCFATHTHCLFTADHVMAWSTSVVSPPGGDMALYLQNLHRLMERQHDRCYLPGHGPLLEDPLSYVQALIAHRIEREKAVLAALGPEPAALESIGRTVYPKIDARLWAAAERNLLGHLVKLAAEGRARRVGALWAAA